VATPLYFLAALACLFSPMLIAWHDERILAAMAKSLLACLKNWRALAFNLIFLIAFCTFSVLPAFALLLLDQVYSVSIFKAVGVVFGVLGVMVALGVVMLATFFSYRSFFIEPEDESEEGESTLSTFFY